MEKYIIIKHIKNNRGISVPVILIDSQNEIMEFDSEKEATELKTLFQANSDSGHIYEVKRII